MVEGDLPVRAANHIWTGKKASWLDLAELAQLPQYAANPTPESNARLMAPLRLASG
jgi:hypothetical protein